MKRSPRNVRRITRRDLDALRLIAAPTINKAARLLTPARKLALLGLVTLYEVRRPGAARASSWTASLTEAGRTLLDNR